MGLKDYKFLEGENRNNMFGELRRGDKEQHVWGTLTLS